MGWMYQSVSKPFTLADLHQALGSLIEAAPELRAREVWLDRDHRLMCVEEQQDSGRIHL